MSEAHPGLSNQAVSEGLLAAGRSRILCEAEALRLIGDSLDESFVAAVRLIRMAPGKVVTVGVGTSGPVARRMAHLLSTSGTASLFLHPGDALHGGLGAITAADVVLAISKGGGSAELNEFMRLAKTRGAALMVLTASARTRRWRGQQTWRWFFRKRRGQIRAALSRWGRAWRQRLGVMRWRSS
jgi:hypothetical protein